MVTSCLRVKKIGTLCRCRAHVFGFGDQGSSVELTEHIGTIFRIWTKLSLTVKQYTSIIQIMTHNCRFCDRQFKSIKSVRSHENYHKPGYFESHTAKTRAGIINITQKRAAEAAIRKRLKRIEEYNKNPKFCVMCSKILSYKEASEPGRKFCSKRCTGLTNSPGRKHKQETKTAIGVKSKAQHALRKAAGFKYYFTRSSKIQYRNCLQCKEIFTTRGHVLGSGRKTCSDTCYQELRTSVLAKKFQQLKVIDSSGKSVTLQSSWEIEIYNLITELKIYWERPKPIAWTNSLGKKRKYYSDFYLPVHNLYLDPKNHVLCRSYDKEKMEIVSKLVNIKWGDLEMLKSIVMALGKGNSPFSSVPQTDALILS